MQSSGPQFAVNLSWGLVALLAIGLAIVSLIVVVTVVVASGRPIISRQRVRSLGMLLLFVLPALAVVLWTSGVRQSRREVRAVLEQRNYHQTMSKKTSTRSSIPPSTPDAEATEVNTAGVGEAVSNQPPAEASAASAAAGSAEAPREPAQADGVLKILRTQSPPPAWVDKGPVPSDDGMLVPISSQRFATLGEAEQQLTDRAAGYVKEFYRAEYPLPGDWTVPVSVIEKNGISAIVGEQLDKDFGNGMVVKMYRAHLLLHVNSALRKGLHESWNEQIVAHRLKELGGFLGLATLALATIAGYFRLDDLTSGQYRRRLKIAAASLITAGSLVAWQVLA